MIGASTILAILAEPASAAAVLHHAAAASRALPDASITALHVRVDPISTIMPTEEVLSDEQARTIELEGKRDGRALQAVFDTWRPGAGVQSSWQDVVGTIDDQVRKHCQDAVLLVTSTPRQDAGRPAGRSSPFPLGIQQDRSIGSWSVGRTATQAAGLCTLRPLGCWPPRRPCCA